MHELHRPWTPQSRRAIKEIEARPSHARSMELAASRNAAVREALAASDATPIGILIALSTDPHPAVRRAVAANGTTARSTTTVRRLAGDPHPDVRHALHVNPVLAPPAPLAASAATDAPGTLDIPRVESLRVAA